MFVLKYLYRVCLKFKIITLCISIVISAYPHVYNFFLIKVFFLIDFNFKRDCFFYTYVIITLNSSNKKEKLVANDKNLHSHVMKYHYYTNITILFKYVYKH